MRKSDKVGKPMEPVIADKSCETSSCGRDEEVGDMDLLEECWFFENLLNIKPRMMPRCYSDPCPSSTVLITQHLLGKDSDVALASYSSTSKPSNNSVFVHPKMIHRAPYMPPIRVRQEDDQKGSNFTTSKFVHQTSDPVIHTASKHHSSEMKGHHKSECKGRKSKLLRTPSLPPSIGRGENFQAADPRIGRSPKQTSKSCSIPRCQPAESINTEGVKEMRRRYLNQKRVKKSLSDLELEEVQGFKDLGFSFEKETLSPRVTSILPGLIEKKRDETEEDQAARRPYLSEAWIAQSCAPPIPNWPSNKSAADMKAQIKFWARAVASSIHQEC